MIGRVFTGFAWAGFLFWTLICLGFWGAVSLGGDLLGWIAGAVLDPAAGGTVTTGLRFLEAFGTALIAWVWLAGTVLIAVAGMVCAVRLPTPRSSTCRRCVPRSGRNRK